MPAPTVPITSSILVVIVKGDTPAGALRKVAVSASSPFSYQVAAPRR